MSRYGESARNMMAILDKHEPRTPLYGLTPADRARLRASGALVEPTPAEPEPSGRRMSAERLAAINAAVAEYLAIEQPAPYGTLRRIAARHGIDYGTMGNHVFAARQAMRGAA